MKYDVIIIGAGHNGLVASFYLARAGLKVLVLEARAILGGCCVTEELIPGFRFSTCANLIWALRPKIVAEMRLKERGLVVDQRQFLRLLPDGRYLYTGRNLAAATAGSGGAAIQEEIAKFSAADAAAFPRWQDFVARLARIFGPHLMTNPPRLHEIYAGCADAEDRKALDAILTNSVADLADRYFESDVMRDIGVAADIGDIHSIGTGLLFGLTSAMGAYSENDEPVLNGYVRGGMGSITTTMMAAAREQGVEFRPSAPVKRIVVTQGVATGVQLETGETIEATRVVSNVDPKRTFLRLLAADQLDPKFRGRVEGLQTHAGAGLKMHCALSEMLQYRVAPGLTDAQLRGSTLMISPNRAYREAAWRAAEAGELPENPILAGFIPSVYDPSLAPAGKHTFSLYITWAPVKLKRGTWKERKGEMAELVFKVMDRYTTNFRRALQDHVLLTPDELETRNYLTDGNIHHLDATPSQLFWQRPLEELAQYRAPVSGLYLCGSGSHPWGEVCGAPGYNAAQVILGDWKRDAAAGRTAD